MLVNKEVFLTQAEKILHKNNTLVSEDNLTDSQFYELRKNLHRTVVTHCEGFLKTIQTAPLVLVPYERNTAYENLRETIFWLLNSLGVVTEKPHRADALKFWETLPKKVHNFLYTQRDTVTQAEFKVISVENDVFVVRNPAQPYLFTVSSSMPLTAELRSDIYEIVRWFTPQAISDLSPNQQGQVEGMFSEPTLGKLEVEELYAYVNGLLLTEEVNVDVPEHIATIVGVFHEKEDDTPPALPDTSRRESPTESPKRSPLQPIVFVPKVITEEDTEYDEYVGCDSYTVLCYTCGEELYDATGLYMMFDFDGNAWYLTESVQTHSLVCKGAVST